MRVIRQYTTKAKWEMYADAAGLPFLGYYGDYQFRRDLAQGKYVRVPDKTNILLHGAMMLTGTARGRSAAHFTLKGDDGWDAHMTMVGTDKMIDAVARGEMLMTHGTWDIPVMVWDGTGGGQYLPGTSNHTGAIVTGYWTVAKQGTEVSLIPAPKEIFADLLSHAC